jgi:RNA polymerase sigma-70 factor (ECF subfamily)
MIDWPALVRQNTPLVWRTVYRLVAHDADAADCLQETFVSAMAVARREPVGNWPGLLQRLATARALDCVRRRQRETVHQTPLGSSEAVASAEPNPLQEAVSRELANRLRLALADLPGPQAEAFCLRNLNGLSYLEVAKELGVSVDAVGVLLHRARHRLRDLIGNPDVLQPNER